MSGQHDWRMSASHNKDTVKLFANHSQRQGKDCFARRLSAQSIQVKTTGDEKEG